MAEYVTKIQLLGGDASGLRVEVTRRRSIIRMVRIEVYGGGFQEVEQPDWEETVTIHRFDNMAQLETFREVHFG